MSQSFRFYVRPAPGERVETRLTLPEDAPAMLAGFVRTSAAASPVADAAVLLSDADTGRILMQAATDEEGRFLLGPLEPNRLYAVRIYHGGSPARTLEFPPQGGAQHDANA